jgi:hypothetical protein
MQLLAGILLACGALGALQMQYIHIVYMDCAQPGPSPGCKYHPYYNSVTTRNTTMDMTQQLQLSTGRAYGIGSASAFDHGRGVLYFFQGEETIIYRVDTKAHQVLAPVKIDTSGLGTFYGVAAAAFDDRTGALLSIFNTKLEAFNDRLVKLDPDTGKVTPLDSSVDPADRVNYGVGGGLCATDGKLLVTPQGGGAGAGANHPHSLSVVDVKTGVAQLVDTSPGMRIYGLEYGDGAFWAVGILCPKCPVSDPMI